MKKTSLVKNAVYEVEITDLGMNGEGICRVNGEVVFVPFALAGERVKIQIINTKSSVAVAKVIEIISKNENRIEPKCPYFTKCGGCDLQHLKYEKALEFKKEQIEKNLQKIGKIETYVDDCVPSSPYGYRNKCALPVVFENGETKIGMFRENSHKLVEIDCCPITNSFIEPLINIVKEYVNKFSIKGFCEETGEGQLKHIVARKVGEHLIVTLVVTTLDLQGLEFLYEKLKEKFHNCSLWLNLNNLNNNVIFGKKFVCKFGNEECIENVLGLSVSINPASFMQVNNEIRDKIYLRVQSEIEKNRVVIDAYSGAGVMTGITAKISSHSYGLEIVPEATRDADLLKARNNITNMTNICGDCTQTLPKLVDSLKGQNINVILDPPRKGCTKEVISAVAKANARKIIYISCNSATLARDLAWLMEASNNYKIKSVTPYDMFPQTRHCEVLCILERVN